MFRSRPTYAIVLAALLAGCASGYRPIVERPVAEVAGSGCGGEGERIATTGYLHDVYEDGVVLWNGLSSDTTVSIRFPETGLGQKARGVVGRNRRDRAYDALRRLQQERREVTVTFTCRGGRETPLADRFSWSDEQGRRQEFELEAS